MELVDWCTLSHLTVLSSGCYYARWPLEAPTSTTILLTPLRYHAGGSFIGMFAVELSDNE
jgi:hypothetical protein